MTNAVGKTPRSYGWKTPSTPKHRMTTTLQKHDQERNLHKEFMLDVYFLFKHNDIKNYWHCQHLCSTTKRWGKQILALWVPEDIAMEAFPPSFFLVIGKFIILCKPLQDWGKRSILILILRSNHIILKRTKWIYLLTCKYLSSGLASKLLPYMTSRWKLSHMSLKWRTSEFPSDEAKQKSSCICPFSFQMGC